MGKQAGHILIVDDDKDVLLAGRMLLEQHFTHVVTEVDPKAIPTLLSEQDFDALLLDMNYDIGVQTGAAGFAWLDKLKTLDPACAVVLMTAYGDTDLAVEALKAGATDFVTKPWQNQKLVATMSAAVALTKSRRETSALKTKAKLLAQETQTLPSPIIGNSPALRSVMHLVDRAGPTEASVLITGENGTGKDLIARALHQASGRVDGPFISVDLGAIPETLFEAELFGHKKGAFTGAVQDRPGRFAAAHGGTLFLDEIGNLPISLQSKLLTTLEQRTITPVGGYEAQSIDVRIISATNIGHDALRDENRFRQDLLFRLNTVEIQMPPLRQRISDIPLLVEYYVAHYCKKYGKTTLEVTANAMEALKRDLWPGNIRALRHAIERAIILCDSPILSEEHFQLNTSRPDAVSNYHSPQETPSLKLDDVEKATIKKALKQHGYNISHSAKTLGLTRAALYRRMEKHGL